MTARNRLVFITAVSSDIGKELAALYLARGYAVVGTHRPNTDVSALHAVDGLELIPCDVGDVASVRAAAAQFASLGRHWDTFVSAVGDLSPIGGFFELDLDDWTRSVHVNAVGQLQMLHALYPHGTDKADKKVGFLVGGGINGPFRNYSAYCLGKISLVKMCELLDDEYADIHAVAVGTGWVRTKIHEQTVAAGAKAGVNLDRTLEFQRSGGNGTPCEDIFECLEWCFAQPRSVTGGRNFSVVHDGWKDGRDLSSKLEADRDKYKLRRYGNE